MSENRPFYGKDGGRYRDYYEKEAADNRYDQQQKIIEETRRQNDLLEKQQRESQRQLLQQQMEQERANQLEQEKIELMKEQESRAKAQQNIAELNKQINSVFRQAQENMVQQIALCKEIGINYKNLSDSNFVIELVEIPYARGGWFSMNTTSGQIQSNNGVQLTNTFSKSYDNDTGSLSISAKITAEMEHHGGGFVSGSTTSTAYCDIKYNVYAIY